ncbi:sinIM, partial [Symbiodinium natans]
MGEPPSKRPRVLADLLKSPDPDSNRLLKTGRQNDKNGLPVTSVASLGDSRPREAQETNLEDAVIGWQAGDEDPTPIFLVKKGKKELSKGEVYDTQSEEIGKKYQYSPIAKAHRQRFNWVAQSDGDKFTRDASKMKPAKRTDGMSGRWTCDVCGKSNCGSLFVFRAFLRQEHLPRSSHRGSRRLDPFVAYISQRCGQGLLGQLAEYTRVQEEIFSLATLDIEIARNHLEESMRQSSRENQQFLIGELSRVAGVGASAPKTVEMDSVERMMGGRGGRVPLLRSPEDVFRAMARSLGPRVNARLLAAAAVSASGASGADFKALEGYLGEAAESLRAGGPLPRVPAKWPLSEVVACVEAILRAANRTEPPYLRVELACSGHSEVKVYGPSEENKMNKAMTIRLGFLHSKGSLHAFAPSKPPKEEALLLQQRLEQVAGNPARVDGAPGAPGAPAAPQPSGSRPRHAGRAESLGPGWHSCDWAKQLKRLLAADFDFSKRPLHLATGCSGAEAPHFALCQLVGLEGFEQLFGAEINDNPRRFMLNNCRSQHTFYDVRDVTKGSGMCARHGCTCDVPHGEIDIFVGGFPCTPFSFCNPKRFKRNCFSEPAAVPFFEMRKFIAARRPRLVILENVRGLLAPNPETEERPIDFILRGRNPEDSAQCYPGTRPKDDWGLELIKGYGLRWDILYSSDWGLPQKRPRVYIVMVRDDVGGQEAADRIFEVLRTCAGHLPPGSCNDFLYPDGHPRLESVKRAETAKTRGSRKVCTKFTEALFRTTRQDFGLGASDRPYSKERPSDWFPRATEKMVQQLDIIYERAQHQGLDLSFLLADLSQQVSRGAWRDDGYVPTLTTASLLYSYSHHRALLGEECLKLNGFPVDELNLDAHTQQELIFLAGNAMSVPVIGAVIFAGLVSVTWGDNRRAARAATLPCALEQGKAQRKNLDVGKLPAPPFPTFPTFPTSTLVDDDGHSESAESEESKLARRAAVLLLMAKEFTQQPKINRQDRKRGRSTKSGLAAAMEASANESSEEEEEHVEADADWDWRCKKLPVAKDRDLCAWLGEATQLLAREANVDVQGFVVRSLRGLQAKPDTAITQLAQQGLRITVDQLRKLGYAEAKQIWGRLLVSEMLGALENEDFEESGLGDWWLLRAKELEDSEHSEQRARLLEKLTKKPHMLSRLLAPLLVKWSSAKGGCRSRRELQGLKQAIEAFLCADVSLAAASKLSKACLDMAKACERQSQPESSQAFRSWAFKLQDAAFTRRFETILTSALRESEFEQLEQTCSENKDWALLRTGAAWQVFRHLQRLQNANEETVANLATNLTALRPGSLATALDRFLRHSYPSMAVRVHFVEARTATPSSVKRDAVTSVNQHSARLFESELNLLRRIENNVTPYLDQTLQWAPVSQEWKQELERRISDWSNCLNAVMTSSAADMQHLAQVHSRLLQQAEGVLQRACEKHALMQDVAGRLLLFEHALVAHQCQDALRNTDVVESAVNLFMACSSQLELQPYLTELRRNVGLLHIAVALQGQEVEDAAQAAASCSLELLPGWGRVVSPSGLSIFQSGNDWRWSIPLVLPCAQEPSSHSTGSAA